MESKDSQANPAHELRKKAEEKALAEKSRDTDDLSPDEARKLIHELRVHQIELEMQNEELRRTQVELDEARDKYFDLYDLAPVGYMTVSEKGLILEANLTAAILLGAARNALINQPVSSFILKEDQDVYYHHRRRLLETCEPQVCEIRMVRAGRSPIWVRLDATVVQDVENGYLLIRTTIIDITDRKLIEDALLESEQSVRRLNENILNLVMALSHDIRSPIVVVVTALKLMLQGDYGTLDPNLVDTLQYLFTHTTQLLGTADEYLGKAVSIDGPLKMETTMLDLRRDIVGAVLDELTESITRREIIIDNHLEAIPAESIPINANKIWMKAVYRNIFTNAIKYGSRGCTISFGLESHESYYRLNVFNSGEPIVEKDQKKLFNRFGRIRTEKTPVLDGIGLGLFFSREIIRAHGGEMWYEAQTDGSNFVFTLPQKNAETRYMANWNLQGNYDDPT